MAGHQWLVWGWKQLSRCPSVQLTLIQGRYVLGVAPLARGTAHCGPGFIGQWTHFTNSMPGCTFPWLAVSGRPSGTLWPNWQLPLSRLSLSDGGARDGTASSITRSRCFQGGSSEWLKTYSCFRVDYLCVCVCLLYREIPLSFILN